MLKISNCRVNFNGQIILRGLNLDVADGECLAIIGESGAGKTTLGLSIMGLLNGNTSGVISVNGTDILSLSEKELRDVRWNKIAMSFQSSQKRLNPSHRIVDQVAEPLISHKIYSKTNAKDKAAHLLEQVGFSAEKLACFPHEISGGEQQRVLIAMALINEPELLILDEPVSSLDAESRLAMLEFLKQAIAGRTALVVTHDLSAAAVLANRTATLYNGTIVEAAHTHDLFSQPRHPYTRALLRSYPDMNTVKDLQGIKGRMEKNVTGCAFHPRCTQSINICKELIPPLELHQGRLLACHRGGIVPALVTKGLSKSFRTTKAVVNVNLTLEHGETLALVGQSGSGKTTLARMLSGLLDPDEGSIMFEMEDTLPLTKNLHRMVQLVFQNPGEALSHRMTVLESVREPLEIQKIATKAERDAMAIKAIKEVQLPADDHFLEEYPHHLSGGELQRVNIARALVLNPQILVADEPTAYLDSSIQAKILKLLLHLQENRGLSMLFITHDIALARKISDRIAVMQKGRIVEIGAASDVINNPSHPYTQNLLKAATTAYPVCDRLD